MSVSFYSLITAEDVSKTDIETIISDAQFFQKKSKNNSQPLEIAKGKILASLFFEPSTRTRMSFEAAMYRLGGSVITLENGKTSSVQKGESLSDMGQVVSGYADLAVMRHPKAFSIQEFASRATIPVINAGDGPNQHPSQSLVDLYAIYRLQNRLSRLTIGFVGDLKYGRTVHSLIQLLSFFPELTFVFISSDSLKLDPSKIKKLNSEGHQVIEGSSLKAVLPTLDVLYMTRIQEERFESRTDFESVNHAYSLKLVDLEGCKSSLSILHPLPRVGELPIEIDTHPAAHYFEQARGGLFVRMALIRNLLC